MTLQRVRCKKCSFPAFNFHFL